MDLYMRPVNLFVAGFIGSPAMNTIAGEVVGRDGAVEVRLEDGPELEFRPGPDARAGMAVTVGMRPEHLMPEGEVNPLTGSIEYVEPTGGQTYYNLDLGRNHVTVGISGATDLRREGTMTVHIAPELVHVFDAQSGERLSV